MTVKVEGMESLKALMAGLGRWINTGSRQDVDQGAKALAKGFQEAIAAGLGADGSPMAPLKKSTLEGPVRRENDSRIRGDLGSIPLNASGKTAASISSKKAGPDTWEVSASTAHGDMILASNAKRGHSGSPFAGDTPKAIRDPVQVSEKQMDIIEDALVKGIDRALNG